jgi:hypothetical protein
LNHTGCGWPVGSRNFFARSTSATCQRYIESVSVTFSIIALPTITPIGKIAAGSITFTCAASSIIQSGEVAPERSCDQIGRFAWALHA